MVDVVVLGIAQDRVGGADGLDHVIAHPVLAQMQRPGPVLQRDEPPDIGRAPLRIEALVVAQKLGAQDGQAGEPGILPRLQQAARLGQDRLRQLVMGAREIDRRQHDRGAGLAPLPRRRPQYLALLALLEARQQALPQAGRG